MVSGWEEAVQLVIVVSLRSYMLGRPAVASATL